MKIFVILAFILGLFQYADAFLLDRLLNIKKTAKENRKAVRNLEPYAHHITATRTVVHSGNCIITTDRYKCYSEISHAMLKKYFYASAILQLKMLTSNLVDSIFLGLLCGHSHKKLKAPITTACLAMTAILGNIAYQNNLMKKVPYFDLNMQKHKNKLHLFSLRTLARFSFMAMWAGLFWTMVHFPTPFFETTGKSCIENL